MPLSRITSASIANSAVAAADIADGTITAAKIVSIANTQITGNIVSSQITSVANTQLTGTITGSQISSNTLSNTVFQTGSVENYMSAAGLGFGMRNRLINGAMVIAQRGTSAVNTNVSYPVDRFRLAVSNSSKVSLQQSSTVPTGAGFVNSILATSLAATTVGSSDSYEVSQQIEGYNIADLGWGTASAKTVTLSFWVRSSLTGTFGGTFENSGNTRAYPFSYTISVANTWEQKTITVAGDTSGTWLTDNSRGIIIRWSLGTGSTYLNTANAWVAGEYYSVTGETKLVATNGATWYITGTQLEVGSTATSFDYRPYTTELALCQRYYMKYQGDGSGSNGFAIGYQTSTTVAVFALNFPVTMRSEPTCTLSNVVTSDGITYDAAATFSAISSSYTSAQIQVTTSSVGAQFRPFRVLGNNNTASYIDLSSEL